jgi:hypothetical protein
MSSFLYDPTSIGPAKTLTSVNYCPQVVLHCVEGIAAAAGSLGSRQSIFGDELAALFGRVDHASGRWHLIELGPANDSTGLCVAIHFAAGVANQLPPSSFLKFDAADYGAMLTMAREAFDGLSPPRADQAFPSRARAFYSPSLLSLSIRLETIAPAFSLSLRPIHPIPLVPTALGSTIVQCKGEQCGVVAINALRKVSLLPLTASSASSSLIGVWLSGVDLNNFSVRSQPIHIKPVS